MSGYLSRRAFLTGASAIVGVGPASGAVLAGQQDGDAFQPAVHGFGFRNWGTRTQHFESPASPTTEAVLQKITSNWKSHLRDILGLQPTDVSATLYDVIATQIHQMVTQRSGANGHCYGMVLTAQQYFEDPGQIPVDKTVASDIMHPTAPTDSPEAPVYQDISALQAAQYLSVRAWLGRLGVVYPDWIDLSSVVRDLRAAIETFGSASILVFNHWRTAGHQLLVYDITEDATGIEMAVYDPNRPAHTYRDERRSIRLTADGDSLSMEPYQSAGLEFTRLLYNRHERIETATDRETVTPLDHLAVDTSTLRTGLFPFGLVLVDTPDVEVSVLNPDGNRVSRLKSTHMDLTRGEYSHMRSLYGAKPGTYRITILAKHDTSYELRSVIAATDTAIVEDTQQATMAAGDIHEYELSINSDGTGSVRRLDEGLLRPSVIGSAGALGGVAAGIVGYREFSKRTD